jgi:hypothetical protein
MGMGVLLIVFIVATCTVTCMSCSTFPSLQLGWHMHVQVRFSLQLFKSNAAGCICCLWHAPHGAQHWLTRCLTQQAALQ